MSFPLSRLFHAALAVAGATVFLHAAPAPAPVRETDVLIYGGTAGGAMAAIQVARMGQRVLLLEPGRHIGGLTTGGLGATDAGQRYTVGGIAREFYRRLYTHYEHPAAWKHEPRAGYFPKHSLTVTEALKIQWFFEPKVASRLLAEMLQEARVEVLLEAPLDRRPGGVKKTGARLTEIATMDGRRFAAKMFIDATYEGDLFAAAGVSYRVGREPNSRYGETLNGVRLSEPDRTKHVSPYVIAGDPKSGLLPRVIPLGKAVEGEGDGQTQAFNFRLCLTDVPENRAPITRPATYDPLNYEVMLRHIVARPGMKLNAVYALTPMPNRKTDTNNRVYFSTDFVGGSHRWAEASHAERATIWQAHRNYQLGLLWFIAHDPRVPEALRTEAADWGLARDEFTDIGHWPHALYVREARRLLGDYVLTEHDCSGARAAEDPLTLGSYAMDSHAVNYVVDAEGRLRVEGWFVKGSKPYPISYRAALPKRTEASNLLVSVCISSSHVAYGSIRMEPVFMNLGQATATAAVLALQRGTPLHDLPYAVLRARLEADGQIFDAPAAKKALEEAKKALAPAKGAAKPVPSALETSPAGWINLLADPALADWQRAPFPATKPLGPRNPWTYNRATGVLHCDATDVHEMFLHRALRADGVLHVEWRYPGAPAKANSGIFARTTPDASTWHQAQLSLTGVGLVFGGTPSAAGKEKKLSAGDRRPDLLLPPGEWNIMEVSLRGPVLTLWFNGVVTATVAACFAPSGQVGLEAEFTPIEFRSVQFKPVP